jgi:chaperonin GroEL
MSTAKELIFEEEARQNLKEGIEQLAKVVGITLGPKGRNVCLDKSWGAPTITNDGNSIVKDIELKCQYQNMGASLCKEIASKMKDTCGDGTTTTILLLQALVSNGLKNISAGASPISLKHGMTKACDVIVTELSKLAIPIKNTTETKNIATIAASGDADIGDVIAKAIEKIGKGGIITIEEGKTTETTTEIVEGMQFNGGYLSSYFCTNPETLSVEMDRCKIFITDKKISSVQEILPMLQTVSPTEENLLIIADDIEGEALSTLVINKINGILKVCAVKAPGFGDRRKAILKDIGVLVGATVLSEDFGMVLQEATADLLGFAEKIIVTKEKTTIIGGSGDLDAIKTHIQQIDNEIKNNESPYAKEALEERKAKLSGGIFVIRVGAATEPEMHKKKQHFEDSLNSTKAALEEGIGPGGGISLLQASLAASLTLPVLNLNNDERLGFHIVLKACETPCRQIVANSGQEPSVIMEQILSKNGNFGFNALTETVENLVTAGIIDSVKVAKHAIQYAVSSASVVILSEALIGNVPNDD